MLSRTYLSGAIVALLLVIALPALSQSPTFTTQTYPANGSSSFGVTTDLNEDGALDFVINGTLAGPCGTCIILSNGDGSYRPPVAYNSNLVPLAAGDLNGDGNADIVFAGIAIAYGNGDGTLRPLVSLSNASAHTAARAAVADFNGDGRQDIVFMTEERASGADRDRLFVLVNNGNGTFTTQGPYATETVWNDPASGLSSPWTVMKLEVGDFDADGRADVAYTVGAKTDESGWPPNHSKIVALFNNGGGALTTSRLVKEEDAFLQGVVGDMNQDGKSDIVSQGGCSATFCGGLYVFYGSSGRTFTQTKSAADTPAFGFPQIADFNGDHRMDVAMLTADFPTDTFGIKVFTQNADGSFTGQSGYALGDYHSCRGCGPPAYYLFAGDFNRDRKPDLATVGGDESVLRVALNTTSASGFPGCLHPGGRGINVCAQAGGSTAASPVPFSIGASDYKPLRKIEVWVDGAKQKETFFSFADYSYLDTSLSLANGNHNVSVYAAGFDNLLQKKSFSFTVGTGGTCAQPATATAVVICAPTNGSTVTSPVHVSAAAGSAVTFMEVWVDGTKWFQTSGNRVSTDLPLGNGAHTMTVFGRNGSVVGKATVTFTVGSGGSTCSLPASATGTVICAPASGSTVTSPVTIQARGGVNVTFMEAWVDGTKRFQSSGNSIFTSLTLAAGSHRLTVYSKNGTGVLSSAVSNFTVQ